MVLSPAQVAEVDREASDGDHGGADCHQQDEDVGRGVHSVALLSLSTCSLLDLLGRVGGGLDQSPHHQLPLVWHPEPAQPGRVQHPQQTGAGEAASLCYVDVRQQDALTTIFLLI